MDDTGVVGCESGGWCLEEVGRDGGVIGWGCVLWYISMYYLHEVLILGVKGRGVVVLGLFLFISHFGVGIY